MRRWVESCPVPSERKTRYSLTSSTWEQVVHKQHPSSFTGTDLQEHLEKVGKKKIVLAG